MTSEEEARTRFRPITAEEREDGDDFITTFLALLLTSDGGEGFKTSTAMRIAAVAARLSGLTAGKAAALFAVSFEDCALDEAARYLLAAMPRRELMLEIRARLAPDKPQAQA